MKSRLPALIDKIDNANSQETVDLDLASQTVLDDDEASLVVTAIKNNKRIKSISFSNINVSPMTGYSFFETFMVCPKIEKITFPIWRVVMSSGQRALMEMEEDFPEAVESYNVEQRINLIAFNFFKALNERKIKLTQKNSNGEVTITECRISADALSAKIKPYLIAPIKKLIL